MQPAQRRVRLKVYVKAMSRETRLVSEPDHSLTLHVAAPSVKGKANKEIVKWLAKKLDRSSSQVRIMVGVYSNSKIIEISEITKNEVARLLGVDPKALAQV